LTLILTMAKVSGKAVDVHLLRRVFRYVKPYRRIFVWSVILTILIAILAPVRPWLIQLTLDKYIVDNDRTGLGAMTLLMIAALLIQGLVQYFHTFYTNVLGHSVIKDLRVHVFNHISSLRLKYFDRTPIGQLITRTVSDLETIADIFSEGLIVIVGDILQVVAILAVMLYTDWELTLVVLIPMPLLMAASYI